MRFRITFITLAMALLLASPALGAESAVGHFCLLLSTPASIASPSQTAERNSYVVLQAWESERAAALKASNPNLSVLVYQNLSAIASKTLPDGMTSSGVNYAEANQHPDWFLEDPGGSRIAENDYPWLWLADVGNPGYQRQWTANVLALLRAGPWDGVLMDDANTTAKYHVGSVARIASYPTDAAYQTAMGSMLAYAGPELIAAGKLAIPNMGAWQEYPKTVEGWLPFVSGGMDEMFVKWSAVPGEGYMGSRSWRTQLEEMRTTQRLGKRFLAVTHAATNDQQGRRYGWATALLGGSGNAAFSAADEYDRDTWSKEYEISLGAALGPARPDGDGVWRRPFANGLVLVNPTMSAVPVSFGGVYSGTLLSHAEDAKMTPHSALILTTDQSDDVHGQGSSAVADTVAPQAGTPPKASRRVVVNCRRALAGKRRLSHRHRTRCLRIVRTAGARGAHNAG